MATKTENETKEKKLKGKALIKEALVSAIYFYRLVERKTGQEKNKIFAKRIGFLKLALKELEGLKEQ